MIEYVLRTTAMPIASRKLGKAAVSLLSEVITDRDQLFNFDLALSEACANVVRHAYKDLPPGDIEIRLSIEPGAYVELMISDWGHGFPIQPEDIKNAEPHAEGGRGLFIMSELVDEFDISCIEGKNSIRLKKNVKDESWKRLPWNEKTVSSL